jgi:hypothetical protein
MAKWINIFVPARDILHLDLRQGTRPLSAFLTVTTRHGSFTIDLNWYRRLKRELLTHYPAANSTVKLMPFITVLRPLLPDGAPVTGPRLMIHLL